jgi:precorrin-2 dehydrogenase / sirohydrochlorin ferrochelatase
MNVRLEIKDKRVLIVGASNACMIKAKKLYDSGGIITIIALKVDKELEAFVHTIVKRAYRTGDEDGYFIVVCATNDIALNAKIALACDEKNILCLNVSDRSNMSMVMIRCVDDIQISVNTNGQNPTFSKWLCNRMVGLIDQAMIEKFKAHTKLRKILIAQNKDKAILKKALDMNADEIEQIIAREEK